MTSETVLARRHLSLWRTIAPLTDVFTRQVNLNYDRILTPMASSIAAERRGLVNELAFWLFRENVLSRKRGQSGALDADTIGEIIRGTQSRMAAIEPTSKAVDPVTGEELDEAKTLSQRLLRVVATADVTNVAVDPRFPGCGYVDSCNGDVIVGNKLFEIKAGNRMFRSVDLRQVAVYLALNAIADYPHSIDVVALFNPRRGIGFEMGADHFIGAISGRSFSEFVSTFAYSVSSGDISR